MINYNWRADGSYSVEVVWREKKCRIDVDNNPHWRTPIVSVYANSWYIATFSPGAHHDLNIPGVTICSLRPEARADFYKYWPAVMLASKKDKRLVPIVNIVLGRKAGADQAPTSPAPAKRA